MIYGPIQRGGSAPVAGAVRGAAMAEHSKPARGGIDAERTSSEFSPAPLAAPLGAVHADLMGANSGFRYRPARLDADAIHGALTCRFVIDGQTAELAVLDASMTGLGVSPPPGTYLAPGTQVGKVVVCYRGVPVWSGDAIAVYQVEAPVPRLGLRFSSDLFAIERVRVREQLSGHELVLGAAGVGPQPALLPDAWRAGVADLAHLLRQAQRVLEEMERSLAPTDVALDNDEGLLFEAVFEGWGPTYHRVLADMLERSRALPPEAVEAARAFASQVLFPLLAGCPMHRRAHDKPCGYAGDYQLMRLYFTERYQGRSLFDRFLHYAAQRYSLGRTVVARESLLRATVRDALRTDRTTRIASLACGPAIELQRMLADLDSGCGRIELLLIDQDEEALAFAHQALLRIATARGLPVELRSLHFSVRQILKPRGEAEARVVTESLRGLDLVYSAGLFDYLPQPVAAALVRALYETLEPGGRLFIGNLRETLDTTWMMEYVLGWHLEYREDHAMLAMAEGIAPIPSAVSISRDATERCMFLDISRP